MMDTSGDSAAQSRGSIAPEGAVAAMIGTSHASRGVADSGVTAVFDGVILLDEHDRVLRVNPAAEEICELRALASTGHALAECGSGEVARAVCLELSHGQGERHGQRLLEVSDSLNLPSRVFRLTLAPMRFPDGRAAGTKITLRDVTSEHRADELRNRYLSIVAHELRTPLTGIKTFVTLLVKRALGPLSEPQGEVLSSVREQVLRLEHQIDKLVHLGTLDARDAAADLSRVELPSLVHSVVASFTAVATERRIAIVVDSSHESIEVRLDRAQMRRALAALVENALKFSRDGGSVRVGIAVADSDSVEISVCDEGIGIDPRYHARIFERFFQVEDPLTRHHGGSGLGLFFVKQIVETHGSAVVVDSEPGRGARFSFRLPIADTRGGTRCAVTVDRDGANGAIDCDDDRAVRSGS